jgi:phosphoserine phosphatase RsbU/P
MTSQETVVDASRDWAIAREVQRRFMQGADRAADAVDHSARCRQVLELGGDCFDFMPLADGRLALTIGDASGKGLAAALMMASVQSSLRAAVMFTGGKAGAVVKTVNRLVHASSPADRFATLFYGVFDASTRRLRYVNAGQNPPMVLRRDGPVEWLEAGGMPVGVFGDSEYEERTVQLREGDFVLAYTDGMTEAVNAAGEDWGVDGLRAAAAESGAETAGEMVEAIFAALDRFTQGRQWDDATVVALRVA